MDEINKWKCQRRDGTRREVRTRCRVGRARFGGWEAVKGKVPHGFHLAPTCKTHQHPHSAPCSNQPWNIWG